MIDLYTGTPGSGKSLDVSRLVCQWLRAGRNVIGTMSIVPSSVAKYKGQYIFVDIYNLHPQELIDYARKFHSKGHESQCLLVIDECQMIFNSRDWSAKDRQSWNSFFQIHRHFGYHVCLITQYDRLIDRQLRALVENQYIHRKISNYGILGKVFSAFFGGGLFISVQVWYPVHEKIGSNLFVYRRKYGLMYDSYAAFEELQYNVNNLRTYLMNPDSVSDADGGVEGAPEAADAIGVMEAGEAR